MMELPCLTDFDGATFGLGLIGARAGRRWVEMMPEWGDELLTGKLDAVAFVVEADLFRDFSELVLDAVLAAMDPDSVRGFHYAVRHLPPFNGRDFLPLAVCVTREAPLPSA